MKKGNGNKLVQVSGHKAPDAEVESWLVTPGLDVSKATNKNFTFDSKRLFSKGETLEVLISENFSGDVKTATWKPLNGYTLAGKDTKSFVNSGNIDLSSYNGVVYIAFKYMGNNTDKSGTFNIDNVKFNYDAGSNGGNNNGGTNNSGTATSLFSGSDFEDWTAFKGALKYPLSENKNGVKISESSNGKSGKALLIKSSKSTSNFYVFTAKVPKGFSAKGKTKISFYIKGTTSAKSLSMNVHKNDSEIYYFNLGDCSAEKTLDKADKNDYIGAIDTKGKWVKVTLNIKGLDISSTEGGKFFSIKYGKKSEYDLLIDDIMIE